jgi:hypothetical protein
MPLYLTQDQLDNVEARATRPLYLVEIWHSGEQELYSSSGRIVYDGDVYEAGGANVAAIQDSFSATVTLPWSPSRMSEIQGGTYRKQPCIIRYIPEAPGSNDVFPAGAAITLIDGQIRSSGFSGDRVSVSVEHVSTSTRYSPNNTINEVTAFVIAPGTQIEWEGDILILEPGD